MWRRSTVRRKQGADQRADRVQCRNSASFVAGSTIQFGYHTTPASGRLLMGIETHLLKEVQLVRAGEGGSRLRQLKESFCHDAAIVDRLIDIIYNRYKSTYSKYSTSFSSPKIYCPAALDCQHRYSHSIRFGRALRIPTTNLDI